MPGENIIEVTCPDDIKTVKPQIEALNSASESWDLNMYFDYDDYPILNDEYCNNMYNLGRACHTANCKSVCISAHDDKPQFWCPFLDGLVGKTSPYFFTFMNPSPGNNCEIFLENAQHMTDFDDEDDSTGIENPIDAALFEIILKLIKSNGIVSLCLLGAIPNLDALEEAFAAQNSIKVLEIHIDESVDGRVLGSIKGLEHLVISSRFRIHREKVVYFDNRIFGALTLGFINGNFDKLESIFFVGGSLCPPFDSNLHGQRSLTGISDLHPMDMDEEADMNDEDAPNTLRNRCLRSAEHGSWSSIDPPSYWKLFCQYLSKSNVKNFVLCNTRFDVDLATCENDCNNMDPEEIVDFGDGIERNYKRIVGHGAHTPYLFKCLLEAPNPSLKSMFFEVPYEISNTLGATVAHAFVKQYKCDAFYYNSRSKLPLNEIVSYRNKMPIPWMHKDVPGVDKDSYLCATPAAAIINEENLNGAIVAPIAEKIITYYNRLVYGDNYDNPEDGDDEPIHPPVSKRSRME